MWFYERMLKISCKGNQDILLKEEDVKTKWAKIAAHKRKACLFLWPIDFTYTHTYVWNKLLWIILWIMVSLSNEFIWQTELLFFFFKVSFSASLNKFFLNLKKLFKYIFHLAGPYRLRSTWESILDMHTNIYACVLVCGLEYSHFDQGGDLLRNSD